MCDQFNDLILALEREQGHPILLSGSRAFQMLFEPDLPVISTLNDDDGALVTDIWISDIADLPAITQEFVLDAMLEMNYCACLQNQAVFALDEQLRIVLSRSDALDRLTAQSYLKKLSGLVEQAQRLRRLLLVLHPQITIGA